MRLLLVGAGGFIGSHLVEHFIARGEHEIVGFDITDQKLRGVSSSNFRLYKGDVRHDRALLSDLVARSDVVLDLVAYANPSLYVTIPLDVFDLNFLENLNIASLCIKYQKRLIQYSSAEVYGKAYPGQHTMAIEDQTDHVLGPVTKQRWIYAAAKSLLERVLYAQGVEQGLDYTIVRPFNFIGPRIDYMVPAGSWGGPRVFAHFMSALYNGGPLYLIDGGKVHRSFLHIEDANSALQAILDNSDKAHNQIFNVGNPANNITIRELAKLMIHLYEELSGSKSKSEQTTLSGEEFFGQGYEDADRLPPDITKLRSLGWEPKYDLRAALRATMLYYLNNPQEFDMTGSEMSWRLRRESRGAAVPQGDDVERGPGIHVSRSR